MWLFFLNANQGNMIDVGQDECSLKMFFSGELFPELIPIWPDFPVDLQYHGWLQF